VSGWGREEGGVQGEEKDGRCLPNVDPAMRGKICRKEVQLRGKAERGQGAYENINPLRGEKGDYFIGRRKIIENDREIEERTSTNETNSN